MNQPIPHSTLTNAQLAAQDDDTVNLASYVDLLFDNRWLITIIAAAFTLIAGAYALIATPVYEANILVQVEDSASSSKNLLGDLSSVFDLKTAATAEMEILRSRFVLGKVVNNRLLYINAEPKYFPMIGRWVARQNEGLSNPGLFGAGGYAWGAEQIEVSIFNVPEKLQNKKFTLTVTGKNRYRLAIPGQESMLEGVVGQKSEMRTSTNDPVEIQVDRLDGNEGARFVLIRHPELQAVQQLQESLVIAEKGKQSGIIGVAMEGIDPQKTAKTLNEIGLQYIRQNIDRKAEEAEKSLAFLDQQLPLMKSNLEKAEEKYNALRNNRGTVDLDEEAKSILQRSVLAQSKLMELKQRRDELLTRYQPSNPLVEAVDFQIRTVQDEIGQVNSRIKSMPAIEQDVLRLTRDVKVNTELYITLLNSAQQLKLVKASKVGNARLLDIAEPPLKPVRPKRAVVVALGALIGLFLGVVGAFIRRNLFGGIDDPNEIEQMLGLTVSAAIPFSDKQQALYAEMQTNPNKVSVLAYDDPQDLAVESLRSFRTSLQFALLGAKNNIVMITGPTPGVGKSFVSVNFAAVLASTGKRVLLIDADLRKGYLQKYFALKREHGLSEVLAGQMEFDKAIHKAVIDNVDFMATGALPPRPAELLAHPNLARSLEAASAGYDYVIVDTAPVLAVTDAMVVAAHVGAVFDIVRGGTTTLGEIEESVKRLSHAGSTVTGIVFNGLKPRIGRYGYGSKYGRYRYAQYKY
jgi:tyrosine-protein kinase Etk/Wzc